MVADASLRIRGLWNMRILFWVCTVILFVSTHYPKLQFGGPEDAPDKIMHFFVFGGWGVLLWTAGYVRHVLVLCVVVGLFGLFDEWTQTIPWVNRTFDTGDLVADTAGGLTAAAWIYAFGRISRGSDSRQEEAREEAGWKLLSSRMNIANLVVAGAFGTLLGATAFSLLGVIHCLLGVGPLSSGILGGFLGGWASLLAAFFIGRRHVLPEAFQGTGVRRTAVWLCVLRSTVLWVGIVVLLWVLSSMIAPSFSAWIFAKRASLGSNLGLAIDTCFAGILGAWVTRRSRVGVARCQ